MRVNDELQSVISSEGQTGTREEELLQEVKELKAMVASL
jgi:hypothetical protein